MILIMCRWAYAKKHNVQLIDEYDSIFNNILPLLSLPGKELRSRALSWAHHKQIGTIRIRNNKKVEAAGADWRPELVHAVESYLPEIIDDLPSDLDLPLYLEDGPLIFLDAHARQAYESAARVGKCAFAQTFRTTASDV